jgi:thiol-disulfide isomerase/thioredoxin
MNSISYPRCRTAGHLSSLCAALILSSSATSAFTQPLPTTVQSTVSPRATVIQRYRTEKESSDTPQPNNQQSDVYSFLPARLSTIERMSEPSQFEAQVLGEQDSLVVVRFYADVCPSCRATGSLFRKWSREVDTDDYASTSDIISASQEEPLPIKILEMPLNRATSSFLKDELQVEKLPYCHLYHPKFGLVEEQVVMNKGEFDEFVDTVGCWSKGGCDAELEDYSQLHVDSVEEIEFEYQNDDDCEEFC